MNSSSYVFILQERALLRCSCIFNNSRENQVCVLCDLTSYKEVFWASSGCYIDAEGCKHVIAATDVGFI